MSGMKGRERNSAGNILFAFFSDSHKRCPQKWPRQQIVFQVYQRIKVVKYAKYYISKHFIAGFHVSQV
jgi:hypothetical protein|tara:strand:+ start:399 stop:602 length:204 start_codon:yes stop_codon:yes gene_type:complete